jgi:hypothetical protein
LDEDHLPAVEALLVLPCCCCTTPVVPLAITGLSRKFSSFKDTFYIYHINNRYVFLSIIPFFIFYVFFLIRPINIVILCPTMVIILLCIFELLLYWTVTIFVFELLLSSKVAFRPLLIFLTISRILELRFKWGWSRWEAKTRSYKSSEGKRTQFCPQDSQNRSSTNQTYCPNESVMTQFRLVTHNWCYTTPNWPRPISLVSYHPKLQCLWRNLILISSSFYPKSYRKSGDESVQIHHPLPFTHNIHKLHFLGKLSWFHAPNHVPHMNQLNFNNWYFFSNSSSRTLIYNSTSNINS